MASYCLGKKVSAPSSIFQASPLPVVLRLVLRPVTSASPGNLLERQLLPVYPIPDLPNETLWGGVSHLGLKDPSRPFWCSFKFKHRCSGSWLTQAGWHSELGLGLKCHIPTDLRGSLGLCPTYSFGFVTKSSFLLTENGMWMGLLKQQEWQAAYTRGHTLHLPPALYNCL